MFTQEEIQPYLDDYEKVTGRATDQFICPLTLERCPLDQITNGHIIPDAVGSEFNRTVPVRTAPDNFYGTRVEEGFANYLRLPTMTRMDLIRTCRKFEVQLVEGGPWFDGFFIPEDEVKEKERHLPVYSVSYDGQSGFIGLKVRKDDPRLPALPQHLEVRFTRMFFPAHWVASMLKMAHLTMFEMLGIMHVFDPSEDMLRRVLARYFYDNAAREDAPAHFRQFENAVKMIGTGTGFNPKEYKPFPIDTLRDRKILCHFQNERHFASTLVYNICGKTMCVIVPQTTTNVDIGVATRLYDRLLSDDSDLDEKVYMTTYTGEGWVRDPQPITANYQRPLKSGTLLGVD